VSKIIILLVVSGFFILHFLALVFYQTNTRLKNVASINIYPFFHQNWTFFTYPPKNNYRLIILTADGAEDVLFTALAKHQTNRLAGEESNVLALTNLIHYFESSNNKSSGEVKENVNFDLLINYLKAVYKNKQIKTVILESNSIETNSKTIYYKQI